MQMEMIGLVFLLLQSKVKQEWLVSLIFEAEADPRMVDHDGGIPLIEQRSQGHDECIELLLR